MEKVGVQDGTDGGVYCSRAGGPRQSGRRPWAGSRCTRSRFVPIFLGIVAQQPSITRRRLRQLHEAHTHTATHTNRNRIHHLPNEWRGAFRAVAFVVALLPLPVGADA